MIGINSDNQISSIFSYITMYFCSGIHLSLSSYLRCRGCSVSCLCPRHKVMWWGLVRGWSETERTTLMWVKAIDRGPAQHHADSDLIAALQNLKTRETRVKTALLFAQWRLFWYHISSFKIYWLDTRLAYAVCWSVQGFKKKTSHSIQIKAVSYGEHCVEFLLM